MLNGVSDILIYSIIYDLPHFFTGEVIEIKIDPEYSCNWWDECNYLLKHNLKYEFVKEVHGVTIWKFKKSEELFRTLADFYSNVYSK